MNLQEWVLRIQRFSKKPVSWDRFAVPNGRRRRWWLASGWMLLKFVDSKELAGWRSKGFQLIELFQTSRVAPVVLQFQVSLKIIYEWSGGLSCLVVCLREEDILFCGLVKILLLLLLFPVFLNIARESCLLRKVAPITSSLRKIWLLWELWSRKIFSIYEN